MGRMIAVVDAKSVLVGRNDAPTDEEWNAAPEHLRFPNGFDNALKRYKLMQWKPGRWRFEAIVHRNDEGAENEAADKAFPKGALARAVFSLSIGEAVSDRDRGLISDYLATFDGAV